MNMQISSRPFTLNSAIRISLFLLAAMVLFSSLLISAEAGNISAGMLASASGLVNLASFIIVSGYAFARYGIQLRLRPGKGTVLLAFSVLAAAAGLVIVLSELDNLTRRLLPSLDALAGQLSGIISEPPLLLSLLLLSVVAPVTEEIFFRGIVLEGLLRTRRRGQAVLLSALLFAVVHLNPVQFSYTFLLGIFLGYVYIAYGSILPGMLIHALINFIPVLFVRLLELPVPGFTDTSGAAFQPPLLDAAGLVLTALGAAGIALHLRKRRGDGNPDAGSAADAASPAPPS